MPRKKGQTALPPNLNTPMRGALAERVRPNGTRRISLTAAERRELAEQRQVETAVALFLDMQTSHSWDEIATQVGITVKQLKALVKSDAFIDKYDEHFVELGHDPRLKAVRSSLTNMLPKAIMALENIITSPDTSDRDRLPAIKEVIRLNGLEGIKPVDNDKTELIKFLQEANISVQNMNLIVPQSYQEAMREYLPPDIVDGQVVESLPSRSNLASV